MKKPLSVLALLLVFFIAGAQSKTQTIVVTFNQAPASATSRFAPIKYNKDAVFQMEFDDRVGQFRDVFAYMNGGRASDGLTYSGKTYTDGAGNKINFRAGIACNAYANLSTIDWEYAGNYVSWSDIRTYLANGWLPENHGLRHGMTDTGWPGYYNNVVSMHRYIADSTGGFSCRTWVSPTNDDGYLSSVQSIGYLASTSQAARDNYPAYPAQEWNHYTSVEALPDGFVQFTRNYIWDWTPSSVSATLNPLIDGLVSGNTASNHKIMRLFSHGEVWSMAGFKQFADYLQTKANDKIWICTLQEFMEYQEAKRKTIKKEVLNGNQLTITLDRTNLPDTAHFQDLSLLVDAPGVSITNVSVSGADKFSYNASTGLVNVFQLRKYGTQYLPVSPSPAPPVTTTPIFPSTGTTTRIEAENYTSMSGVQTETTYDAGGGKNVGWIDNGDWMEYSYTAPSSGTYTLNLRVAALNPGGQLQIKNAAGTVLTTVSVPATGGYQTFQTISTTLSLPAGSQTLRVVSSAPTAWNFNWLELTAGSSTTSPTVPTSPIPVPSTPSTPTTSTSSKIEAENYTSMSGVQTEVCYDAGGGKNVGWIEQGDWMDYSVTVPSAGSYTLNLRVATPNTGAQAQVKNTSGTVLSTVTLPNTGAYQTWQTTSTTLNLQAGTQTIRVQAFTQPGWNINWLELVGGSSSSSGSTSTPPPTTSPSTPSTSTSQKIEAESYASMSGIQTEVCYDAGGGKNVGWTDQGDWMEYSVTVPSAGSYTLNLRVATPNNGAQVQVKNANSTILTTVTLPNTGAYQTWQTTSTTLNLQAGQQTIRLQSSAAPGWNINWLEVVSAASVGSAQQSGSTATASSVAPSLEVVPSAITDKFMLQVSNELTGTVDVQILNAQAIVAKQFSLTKSATGTSQFYVSIGDLTAGTYTLKASMSGWSQSTQVSKL